MVNGLHRVMVSLFMRYIHYDFTFFKVMGLIGTFLICFIVKFWKEIMLNRCYP